MISLYENLQEVPERERAKIKRFLNKEPDLLSGAYSWEQLARHVNVYVRLKARVSGEIIRELCAGR